MALEPVRHSESGGASQANGPKQASPGQARHERRPGCWIQKIKSPEGAAQVSSHTNFQNEDDPGKVTAKTAKDAKFCRANPPSSFAPFASFVVTLFLKDGIKLSRPFRALSEKDDFPRAALVPRLPWAGLSYTFGAPEFHARRMCRTGSKRVRIFQKWFG